MQKNKKKYVVDRDFQNLAIRVNKTLIKNEANFADQKQYVEKLMNLEMQLLALFKKYSQTQDIYSDFINYITQDVGNIIVGQLYFRAGRDYFMQHISPVFKQKDAKQLMQFHPNYMLIQFVIDRWKGKLPDAINSTYQNFLNVRNTLIENNMPLAINRAKLFFKKVPTGSLDLLDFVDICVVGLARGIDKYDGEYKSVWISVCIANMTALMMEEYNNNLVRMFPNEKKILYRVNTLRHKLKTDDIVILTKAVNESFEKDKKEGKGVPKLPIEQFQLVSLINSSSSAMIAPKPQEIEHLDEGGYNALYEIDKDARDIVFEAVEREDVMRQVYKASNTLLIKERKIIRLKGVDL